MEEVKGGQLWLTNKIDAKLEELTKAHGVRKEGLGNILLLLAMSDDCLVKQAVNLIKTWDIKGGMDLQKMENRGATLSSSYFSVISNKDAVQQKYGFGFQRQY